MRTHGGYNRDNLEDWLNMFQLIKNKSNDKYDKVLKFIEISNFVTKKGEIQRCYVIQKY